MTEFYLIRHGQTSANALGLKQGVINTDITHLNDVGQQQAQNLADNFDISFADRIICSPLDRTRKTAATLNAQHHLPITYDDRLLEISYGQWDGKKNSELREDYPDVFNDYLNDVLPTYVKYATEGERFEDVIDRARDFRIEMTKKYPSEKIIVVTHGFTVKAFALDVLRPSDLMSLPEPRNTSVTKLVSLNEDETYLEYYNQFF
ncbi:histidine phosphatase family protein [Companilactobacillus sp.]|jgi:probable phosphoglycerate mutase|uniref:histidine phosphatase family protein n=1 Tax=Companilactobacillus sp. TaxID=2767905 RepID=UPI0025BEB3D4|nr:histidine phosphatase family protein [Companilactobacillus sp.]MCH4009885.1 histidine phosphatase family protein [Companilactobacillus sp.]MCH4052439.1 histidine phosphatase family protein [Companilactobacillus sp.]MCH4077827.1 histidine phosphatase family protein [Companilactobacillus sp.]MCH4126403.1 histidine phosphatase family protein [Companilactobacillus sp.]MCI1312725.1 histidine phosphatase family protein [Companilactobacillus sp.]